MRPASVAHYGARVIGMRLLDNPRVVVQRSTRRVQVRIGEAEALDISDDAAREFAIRIRAIADGTPGSILDAVFDYATEVRRETGTTNRTKGDEGARSR